MDNSGHRTGGYNRRRIYWLTLTALAILLVLPTGARAQFERLRGSEYIDIARGTNLVWGLDTLKLRAAVERWTNECLDSITVPLGGYEYIDHYVPGSGGTFCDTSCYLYRLVGRTEVELTAADVAELQQYNMMRLGGMSDTCRDRTDWRGVMTICFVIDSTGGAVVDMRQSVEGYPRPCPTGGSGVMCIRYDWFELWRALRRKANNPPLERQFLALDTVQVDCSQYWGYPTGSFPLPNAMLVIDTVRCWDDSMDVLVRSKVWVSAGRDTTVHYDKCRFPCPEISWTVTKGGYTLDTNIFEKTRDTIRIDTLNCSLDQRLYEIPTSVSSVYVHTFERRFNPLQIDSLRSMLSLPVDSISGFRIADSTWLPWRSGYRPFLFAFRDVHWNPSNPCQADSISSILRYRSSIAVQNYGLIDSTTWSLNGNVNPYKVAYKIGSYCYDPSSATQNWDAVHYYIWLPDATIDSIVNSFVDSCRIINTNGYYLWGPTCSISLPFIYYCSGSAGSTAGVLYYDYPDYSSPLVFDTVATVIYTGEYDTTYVQVWDPDAKTYTMDIRDGCACIPELNAGGISKELCGPFSLVNLCPDGYQPQWVDDTTLAIYASCIDENRVYSMEVGIQQLWTYAQYLRDRDAGLHDTLAVWRDLVYRADCCSLVTDLQQRLDAAEDTLNIWRSIIYREECCDSIPGATAVDTLHFVRNTASGISAGETQVIPTRVTFGRDIYVQGLTPAGTDTLIGLGSNGRVVKMAYSVDDSVAMLRERNAQLADSIHAINDTINAWRSKVYAATGGAAFTTSREESNFTTVNNRVHTIDGAGSDIDATLHTASNGHTLTLKRIDDGTGGHTVTVIGSFDGLTNPTLAGYDSITLVYHDGWHVTNWYKQP